MNKVYSQHALASRAVVRVCPRLGGMSLFWSVFISPVLWWSLLVMLIIWWLVLRSAGVPYIYPSYDKTRNRPGDLCHGGSDKTSGTEQRVRDSLRAMGFTLLPCSVYLVLGTDSYGRQGRKITPDIILAHHKVIVEVDPLYHHGGLVKIVDDLERNTSYARLGYRVVRVRIAWGTQPYGRLSPLDVVTDTRDWDGPGDRFHPDLLTKVREAIRSPVIGPDFFQRELYKLKPPDAEDLERMRKNMPGRDVRRGSR